MQSNIFNLCKRTFSFDLRFAALKALVSLRVAGMIGLQEWSRRKKLRDLGCPILHRGAYLGSRNHIAPDVAATAAAAGAAGVYPLA